MSFTEDFLPSTIPHPATLYRRGVSLLIVDDDPMMIFGLGEVLKQAGYRVLAATSPLEALQIASTNIFDMLITDFQMPAMDGFELASRLTRPRVALPVLIHSGAVLGSSLLEEIANRHWKFVPKPIGADRLLRIVDAACTIQGEIKA